MKPEHKTLEKLLSELDEFEKAPKRRRKISAGWLLVLAVLLVTGSVIGATILLTQSTPPVTPTTNPLTKGCNSTLVKEGSIITGQSGFIVFDCGPMAAAFTVSTGGSFTFSVSGWGTTWTTAFVFTGGAAAGATTCATAYATHMPTFGLTSGSPSALVTLAGTTSYAYCVDYASAPSTDAPPLTFTWSQ